MIAAVLQRSRKANFTGYISWLQDPCQRKFRLFTTMRPKLGQQRSLMSGHARQAVAGRRGSHVKLPLFIAPFRQPLPILSALVLVVCTYCVL